MRSWFSAVMWSCSKHKRWGAWMPRQGLIRTQAKRMRSFLLSGSRLLCLLWHWRNYWSGVWLKVDLWVILLLFFWSNPLMGIPRINGIALPICGCCCFLFQVLDDDSFVLQSDGVSSHLTRCHRLSVIMLCEEICLKFLQSLWKMSTNYDRVWYFHF